MASDGFTRKQSKRVRAEVIQKPVGTLCNAHFVSIMYYLRNHFSWTEATQRDYLGDFVFPTVCTDVKGP